MPDEGGVHDLSLSCSLLYDDLGVFDCAFVHIGHVDLQKHETCAVGMRLQECSAETLLHLDADHGAVLPIVWCGVVASLLKNHISSDSLEDNFIVVSCELI